LSVVEVMSEMDLLLQDYFLFLKKPWYLLTVLGRHRTTLPTTPRRWSEFRKQVPFRINPPPITSGRTILQAVFAGAEFCLLVLLQVSSLLQLRPTDEQELEHIGLVESVSLLSRH
jgi:hypothetical protein